MGKYLKLFETHSEYEAFTQTEDFLLPNVSYCEDQVNVVHYNPWVETKLVVYYDIQDISGPTTVCTNFDNSMKSMEVDGVMLDNVTTTYQFDSIGEHIIKYEFNNPTSIGNSAPLFNNVSTLKRAIIPETITIIGANAFNACGGLTSIDIPSSVTSIGSNAFNACTSLTSIDIPNSVTSIGTYAFNYCSNLTSINIPSSVTSIGEGCFTFCENITNFTVESGNLVYDSRNNCNAIIESSTNTLICGCQNTMIPNNVLSIGSRAFNGCTTLTNIDIPNSVISIGDYALCVCSGLTSITIPNSVTSIGDFAFNGCGSLSSITSNATTAPTITNNTFNMIKSNGTLTVPSGSTGYNTWMGTGNYYLGKYGWTKVEQ